MPTPLQQPPTRATSNPNALQTRFVVESPRDNQLALFKSGAGEALSKAEQLDLLKQVKAGDHVELEFEAVTFIQRETPNRNFVRFQPASLAAFAKSFSGQPFLMNHDDRDVRARGGTIIASKLETNDAGEKQMRMRVRAVKGWAVEGLLDGTIDRFSISWDRNGAAALCSLCNEALWSCEHRLGRADDKGRIAEVLIKGSPIGTEMSTVNVPAVIGTSVGDISQLDSLDPAQLADILGRDASPSGGGDPEKESTMNKLALIAASLGLAVTATEDEVVAAADQNAARLKIAEAASRLASEESARLAAEEKKRADEVHSKHVESAIAQLAASGKLAPGDDVDKALRALAAPAASAVFDAAVASLAKIPSVTPVGAKLPGLTPEPTTLINPATPVAALSTLNPSAVKQLRALGYKDEDINKHAAGAVEYINAKDAAGLR